MGHLLVILSREFNVPRNFKLRICPDRWSVHISSSDGISVGRLVNSKVRNEGQFDHWDPSGIHIFDDSILCDSDLASLLKSRCLFRIRNGILIHSRITCSSTMVLFQKISSCGDSCFWSRTRRRCIQLDSRIRSSKGRSELDISNSSLVFFGSQWNLLSTDQRSEQLRQAKARRTRLERIWSY